MLITQNKHTIRKGSQLLYTPKTSTQNANNDFTIVTLKESVKYYWKNNS